MSERIDRRGILGGATQAKGGNGSAMIGSMKRTGLGRLLILLMLIVLLPVASVADNLTCDRLPMLMEGFLVSHYAMKHMTGEIKTHTLEQMIKRLDGSKSLLYESDVEKIKRDLLDVFASMQEGNCAVLQGVYDLLVTRARENERFVKSFLGPNYKLDETVELNINMGKRAFAKTVVEKQELLKKFVHFQIANALLAGIGIEEAKKQQIHRYELQTMRVIERNPEQLVTTFAEAFASALDPHTSYLSPENMEDFRIQIQLSLEGIGAVLSNDNGFTVIEELIPGGSAEQSGLLKPRDKIIAVAQEGEQPVDVIDMDLRDIIKMIRGKKGTKVTLTILRQTERTERFDITITRDKIDIKEQEAKISYETRMAGGKEYKFGVIELLSFYGGEKDSKSCYEDVKNLLADAKRQHVDGIVLNLSRNGGGLLREAVRIAGLFLAEGGVVATKDAKNHITILANGAAASEIEGDESNVITYPQDANAVYTGPLAVLTSRLSASASEIVAGALKDYRRAVILGLDHTFGKGSVQMLTPLRWELGGMKVTTGLYFLPGGKSTQKAGVDADIVLPAWFGLEDVGEAALDYPLPTQAISPFLSLRATGTGVLAMEKPVDGALIATLAEKSRARIAGDAKFAEIIKNNKEAVGKNGVIRLADFRKEMEKDAGGKKKETRAELKQKARDHEAPFVDESVNVLLDMVTMGGKTRHDGNSALNGTYIMHGRR